MTVATTNNRKLAATNGVDTAFPFDFQLLSEGDFKARHYPDVGSPADLTLSTDFTLSAGPWPSGGTCTTVGSPLTAGTLVMYRDMSFLQGTDLENNRSYNADVYEQVYDRLVLLMQQLNDTMERSVVQDLNATVTNLTIPAPTTGRTIVGNAAGDGYEIGPTTTEISNAQTYATNAASSETNAAASEVNAAASEANAATSEANAALSATTSADIAFTVSGTDTYTATPGISAYTTGKTYYASVANTNTVTNPTLNFDALGEKTIKNLDGSALSVGAIPKECFFRYDGTDMLLLNPTQQLPTKNISGLIASNNATDADHDLDISTGKCRDSADTTDLTLASALTKQIDASWAAGTNAGMLSSSLTLAADTTYHIFAVAIGGSVDVLADTSITCANGVTDHSVTAYKRIGSRLTDGSANLIGCSAYETSGGEVEVVFDAPIVDVNDAAPGTSANLGVLSAPPNCRARFIVNMLNSSSNDVGLITSPDQTDSAPSGVVFNLRTNAAKSILSTCEFIMRVDASSQIRYRVGNANSDVIITTFAYYEDR